MFSTANRFILNVLFYFQLIPLFVSLGVGVAAAAFYSVRLAVRNPDVTWDRKNNPEPWQHYAEKQYKVFLKSYLSE